MDYEGMLEDLKLMYARMRASNVRQSLWVDECNLYHSVKEFMSDIKELLASEDAYLRG